MVAKVIDLKDFSKELEKISKENIEAFKESVVRALFDSIPQLVEKSPIDTGLYAQSWKVEYNQDMARIGNIAPHSSIIEYGARPFTPPIRPLLEWARRVLQRPDFDDDVWALAVGTRNKIQVQGMKPKFVLTNAIGDIIEDIKKEFARLR